MITKSRGSYISDVQIVIGQKIHIPPSVVGSGEYLPRKVAEYNVQQTVDKILIAGPTNWKKATADVSSVWGAPEGLAFYEGVKNIAERRDLGITTKSRFSLQLPISGEMGYVISHEVPRIVSAEMEANALKALSLLGMRDEYTIVEKSRLENLKKLETELKDLLKECGLSE